jgi:Neuraminidase (sialidase)
VASALSPFSATCAGKRSGKEYRNAEVEPALAVNPSNPSNLLVFWQQDYWDDYTASGLVTAYSFDGGRTFARSLPHFTRCSGGTAATGGNYERATDPWVSFGPDGIAYAISLSFNQSDADQAILASRSLDGGRTWSEPAVLARDTEDTVGLDKESITADPHDPHLVYAVWNRSVSAGENEEKIDRGPTWMARSTNGGQSWEPARIIYDPGPGSETIANQVAVLPGGELLNVLTITRDTNSDNPTTEVAVIRSGDKGSTWSPATIVNQQRNVGVTDPGTGHKVSTGLDIPDIAVDGRGNAYVVWQDGRFSGGKRDGVALSVSTDGGRTWSAPRQVNGEPNSQAFTPSVDVTDDGTICVSYYDFRRFRSHSRRLDTDYWLTTSSDGGRTWREARLAGPFDMRTAPDQTRPRDKAYGYFVGDFEGLGHSGTTAYAAFVVTNSGNSTNRTDVMVTAVRSTTLAPP